MSGVLYTRLWYTVEIYEKQTLVFFIGGIQIEIKNLVKIFEWKTLKQAYNLFRLQENILSYKYDCHNSWRASTHS